MTPREYIELLAEYGRRWAELKEREASQTPTIETLTGAAIVGASDARNDAERERIVGQ